MPPRWILLRNSYVIHLMEAANRDEARRCLYKAKNALRSGCIEDADRLAKKSYRLCPSQETQEFLARISSNAFSTSANHQSIRQECPETPPKDEISPPGSSSEYTSEQLNAVKRVLKYKNYYKILGVTQDVSDVELKKQYKRLALLLHPDKNRAPQSDEAFKAVSNAFATLSDTNSRNQYDRFGEDGLKATYTQSHWSPEDQFRMAFGDILFQFNDNNDYVHLRHGNTFMSSHDSGGMYSPHGRRRHRIHQVCH